MIARAKYLDTGHVVQFYGHDEEPAANAIVHAQTGFTLDLRAGPDVLRISVRDASPLPGGAAVTGLPAAPLHGLGAVDALASRWGVEPLGHSAKSVWVELRR